MERAFESLSLGPDPLVYNVIGTSWGKPVVVNSSYVHFPLNANGCSWVDITNIGDESILPDFETLWGMHPEERGLWSMRGVQMRVKRYMCPLQMDPDHGDAPKTPEEEILQCVLPAVMDMANHWLSGKGGKISELRFNACYVNWYETGEDCIGLHGDKTRDLILTEDGETAVFNLVLQEELSGPGSIPHRIFRIKPAHGGRDRIDIVCANGTMMLMGGCMQSTHKHSVPVTKKRVGRRISITLRCKKRPYEAVVS